MKSKKLRQWPRWNNDVWTYNFTDIIMWFGFFCLGYILCKLINWIF